MDSLQAFVRGEAARRAGNKVRVFDWNKAAKLILLNNPTIVSAGLRDDWEWTGGTIYQDGKPETDSYTYLSSCWAIPEIDMDGSVQECWCWQDDQPTWGSDTKWPESALEILKNLS